MNTDNLKALISKGDRSPLVVEFVKSVHGFDPSGLSTEDILAKISPPVRRSTVRPPTVRAETRDIEAEFYYTESGYDSWTRIVTYSGTIAVPLEIIRQGENEVREWIIANRDFLDEDHCGPDYGDSETTDRSFGDWESDNIDDVIEELEEEEEEDE